MMYVLTLLTTTLVVLVLPILLVESAVSYWKEHTQRRTFVIASSVAAGYLGGAVVGWVFRPYGWSHSFVQTLAMQTADHSIEYYAERVLLWVLAAGTVGAWVCGIGAVLTASDKSSNRESLGT